jgi:hypothetical protein
MKIYPKTHTPYKLTCYTLAFACMHGNSTGALHQLMLLLITSALGVHLLIKIDEYTITISLCLSTPLDQPVLARRCTTHSCMHPAQEEYPADLPCHLIELSVSQFMGRCNWLPLQELHPFTHDGWLCMYHSRTARHELPRNRAASGSSSAACPVGQTQRRRRVVPKHGGMLVTCCQLLFGHTSSTLYGSLVTDTKVNMSCMPHHTTPIMTCSDLPGQPSD